VIELIYGPSGCGKSSRIYEMIIDDLKNGKKPFLIVPDQQILSAERKISEIAGEKYSFQLEVMSFRRLANQVFRTLGGLSFNNIDDSGKHIIMWRTLEEIAPFLREYKNSDNNSSFSELMMNTVNELKQYSVTPSLLDRAASKIKESHPQLSRKLLDISLVYSSYQAFFSGEYNDPIDELTRLANILKDNDYFSDKRVYFDSFDSFTPQQYDVIHNIIRQAEKTIFTLTFDPHSKNDVFGSQYNTYSKIKKLSQDSGVCNETYISESISFKSEEIKYVSENLWRHDVRAEDYDGDTSHINTIACKDVYEECEAVVGDILKKVRNGAKYKDIVIIARDIKTYEGLIDAELEYNGVPFFMSKRTDLSSKPIFKLILAAFAVKNRNWRYNDVISYAKTGLTGLTHDECDMLENYSSVWNINGSRWTDGIEWNMNPDGLSDFFSEEGRKVVAHVNNLRNKLVDPLIKFFDSFGESTVYDITKAVYELLCDLSIRDQINTKAETCRKNERFSEEKELVQLWNILIDTLDRLVELAGILKVTPEKYIVLLSMVLSKTDIGTIPSSIDQVILGSASGLRTDAVEHVYLLGVNEGIFPKALHDDGLFSDNEKNILKSLDIDIEPCTDEKSSDELFWFYKAVSRARSYLTLVYSDSDLKGGAGSLSIVGSRVNLLLNNKPIVKYADIPVLDKLEGIGTAVKLMSLHSNDEYGVAIREVLSCDKKLGKVITAFDEPLVSIDNNIDSDITALLYKGNIATSQSRIDSYVKCSFEYHCKHIIKLKEKQHSVFKSNDIGTFVHAVLERFMSRITNADGIDTEIEQSEIEFMVDEIISDYIRGLNFGVSNINPRLEQLIKRLRTTTLLLIDNILSEFRQSDFVPSFFELPIYNNNDKGIEPYEIKLDDGTVLYMRGYVDRVDTLKKGKDVYVRIVDYKTGTKTFSPDDIYKGLNLQMFLYLFAVWNTKKDFFMKKVKCDGDILPAGILYFSARSPEVDITSEEQFGFVYDEAKNSVERKGMLINDLDILKAMDKKLDGTYIPVKLKKNGEIAAGAHLCTIEEWGKLSEKINNILKKIASDMKSGRVKADPLKTKNPNENPCLYCKMKPICRRVEGESADE